MVPKELHRVIIKAVISVVVYSIGVICALLLFPMAAYNWLRSSPGAYKSKRRELPPDCLNDAVYGEHSYIQIKNIKLHYVENGDRSKPLMLFLHGFPEFWFTWRHQIKHFSKHYWTVAVDMRGYGDSEKPVGVSQYRLRYLVNDVKNLINALGREKCILVAHDWGSIIGWYFLLKYPDLVEKYVMLNVFPVFASKSSWKQMLKSWYFFFFHLPYLPEIYCRLRDFAILDHVLHGYSCEEIEAYKFMFGKPGAITCALNYYRANAFNLPKIRRNKPNNVELPEGLLIYTDDDAYLDVSNFHSATKVVENLQTSFIKSASHFTHERKHEDVNKAMSTFLGVVESDDPRQGKSVQPDDIKA